MARFRVGNYLAWQGKFEEVLTVLKTVPNDVSPMLVERIKAETLIQIGRVDEAQAIVAEYLNRHPKDEGGSFTSVNALLLAKAGKRKEAEGAINRATEIGKGFGHLSHGLQHSVGVRGAERTRRSRQVAGSSRG
jgi:predicted Zn-dependent protease